MLIDEVLPEYEASCRREVVVQTSADRVYAAILTSDLHLSPWLRLFRPPATWFGRWHHDTGAVGQVPLRLADLRRYGVLVLAERPPDGIALGAVARLWSVRPSLQRMPADFFERADKRGFVKVAASFEAIPGAENETLLVCEFRFLPIDDAGRRRFRLGWPIGRILVRLAQGEVMTVIERRALRPIAVPSQGG